ncbi:MAG: hypothetical protein P8X82_19375, partial [Gemmatimonadales bacterium]
SAFAGGDLTELRAGAELILPTSAYVRRAQQPASPPANEPRAGCDGQAAMTIIRGTSMHEAMVRQCDDS